MNQNMIGGKTYLVLPNIVTEEESDYVFVGDDVIDDIDDGRGGGGLCDLLVLDGEEEWDEVSYDYDRCDLSPSLSCATSVATNVTLKDMNIVVSGDSGVATSSSSSSSSMDVDDDDDDDGDDTGGQTPMDTEDDDDDDGAKAGATAAHPHNFPAPSANPKNGRRLSNKKLRRKMKMMKKAAAARALAEQKAAIAAAAAAAAASSGSSLLSSSGATTSSGGTSLESIAASSDEGGGGTGGVAETTTSSPGKVARPGGSDGWASLAVACARESLMAYRMEVEAEKEQLKKTRTVSISE